jgi:hypothetical protein
LQGKRLASSFTPLHKQLEKIQAAAKSVHVPSDWQPKPAHLKVFTPSVSMLVWAHSGNTVRNAPQFSNKTILDDKKVLIEEFAVLQERGDISLSDDIVLVAEGCDTGDYLPLMCAALTRDGKNRVIRHFLINGSQSMINKACKVSYRVFNPKSRDMIYERAQRADSYERW